MARVVVRELGVFERARVQSDRARLFASRKRDAAVQPPGIGETCVGNLFAQRVRRTAEHRGCLRQIILKKPRFGQRGPDAQLVVATQRAGPQHPLKQGRHLISAAAFEGRGDARQGG